MIYNKKMQYIRLHKLVDITAGFAFKSKSFLSDSSQTPLVKCENIQQGYIEWSKSKYWSTHAYEDFQQYHLKNGDIVVAMDRPWVEAGLKWAYIKENDPKALLVQRVSRLRAKDSLNQNYLRALIGSKYFEAYLQPIVTGVNVPHISAKQIGQFSVPLPVLPTQKKVAAILTAYDDLIEANNRRIELLENMAEEIYREWFVRLRFPEHEKVKVIKGVPEGWEVVKLGSEINITMGQSPNSKFYNDKKVGLPFHQGVGTYGKRHPIEKFYCSVDGRKAKKGDILFSVRAPVGRLNIADRELIIGRGLSAINHKKGFNTYLFSLLKSSFSNEDLIGNGSIFNAVSKKEILDFSVFKPTKKIVENYEVIVKPISRQIDYFYQQNKNLTKIRDALLPRLISGKLSVEDLDIHFPPSMKETIA